MTLMNAVRAVCVAIFAASVATGQTTAQRADMSKPSDAAIEMLERVFQAAAETDLSPGFAVAIVQGDQTVHLRGYGATDLTDPRPVDEHTMFYIASATKPYFAMLTAILDNEGLMQLDEPIDAYLDHELLNPDVQPSTISLRAMLDHTHGIAPGALQLREAFFGNVNHDELLELLAALQPAEHGRTFRYTNMGYNIVALAMREFLNESWKDLMEEKLFRPAGMRSTTAYVSRLHAANRASAHRYEVELDEYVDLGLNKQDETMQSAGGILTCASDLARWLKLNLNDGRIDGEQVVPADVVRESHRMSAETDSRFGPLTRTAYGMGWYAGELNGESQLHHFGSFAGWSAHLSLMPEKKIGVAMVANGSPGGLYLNTYCALAAFDLLTCADEDVEATGLEYIDVIQGAFDAMRQSESAERARRMARTQVLPRPLNAYTGSFYSPQLGTLTIEVRNDRLHARLGLAESAAEVYDAEQESLRLELTGGGSALRMHFKDGESRASACDLEGFPFERIAD
jgi:CubicO group peptidase (beta-lactamase class C family)